MNIKKFTKIFRPLLFMCIFLQCTPMLYAQSKKKTLENRKKKLQEEINYTNKLLNQTQNNKKISLNQLITLNKKISVRQELMATINYEITLLDKQIDVSNDSLTSLQNQLKQLKDEYAKMIYFAYKNQDAYSRLMFIFASKDFNQAYMRMKYLQEYSDYRHKQALEIEATQQQINQKIQQLEKKKESKKQLLASQQTQKEKLTQEKQQKQNVFVKLQRREKDLKKQLREKQRAARRLQKAIQRIIEEEIRAERERAARNHKAAPKGLVLTPEAKALSKTFASNKGKLPWPVVQGVIVSSFGVHPHPVLKGVVVRNDGIDIATTKGGLARAVFKGVVTGVVNIPSSGKAVIIRHGEYLSVYSNLKDVYVKTGDKVNTKQSIGSVLYDNNDGKTELHLEIWKGQTKLNPADWLYSNNH